jgi:type IV pilus assembly protein PilY1
MNMSRKLQAAALSFAYVMTAVSPAMADDTEIYIGGSAATGGAPNVLMLLDNSGSMNEPMYDKYPEGHPLEGDSVPMDRNGYAVNPDDKRGAHLKEAAKRLLENMNGDIRVGIASYNQYGGTGYGGRIRYPASRLDDSVSSSSTGEEERNYIVSASADDASQVGALGGVVTNQSELPLGDSPDVALNITADNYAHQNKTSTLTPSPARITLGGSAPYRVGFRFPGISIPRNATIISASFDLKHCTGCTTTNSITNSANGAFSFILRTENDTSSGGGTRYDAQTYSDSSSSRRISGRNYFSSGGAGPVTLAVTASELVAASATKSVDVKNQLQALVSNANWSNSAANDIAFALEPTGGSYTTAKGRLLQGPTSLKIVYNEGGSGDTFSAVRFQSVDIPRGATINSAELVFQPSRDGSSAGTWEIGLEKTSEAVAFDATNHLDSSRWTGAYVKSYSPGNWVAGTDVAIDVKSLLSPLVANTGFCGGGNVAFRVRDTSAGARRYAVSYDDDQVAAPRLKVKYTLPTGSTCLRSSRIATVRSSNDDAEQTGSVQETVALNVPLRSSSKVGLRFSGITIPQGATIRSAKLKLKAANEPSSRGTFTIKAAKLTDIGEFSDSNKIGSITDLTSASVAWSPSAWKTGSTYESGELKTVIQEVVNQTGWNAGNALALIVNGSLTGSSFPRAYQADYGASAAASLSIVYDSDNPADAVRRVRQDLLDLIKNYTFTTSTPLGEAYYETARYMLGYSAQYGKSSLWSDAAASQNSSQVYISPMDGGQCQSNNIIMLTDGAPTNDADNQSVGVACNSPFDCMNKNAEYLKKTGKTGSSGEKSLVTTYTVGFGPDVIDPNSSAYKGLATVARVHGGGEFFAATDADSLSDSFKTIFSRIADTSGTMASPGVAVNQLNRSQHLDQLYYGVFEPTTNSRWAGNLKRYRLGADDSVQATNGDAIDPKTKFFSTNAQSWWSDVVDGNKVSVGGAAGEQTVARTVYVDNGTGPMTVLDANNPPSGLTTDLVQWIQGLDVDDVDSNGITNEARKAMGAPIHGQPTMVSYGSGTEDYVVFIGSNDGLLHSINVNNGSENWAWLPRELINNVPVLRNNPGMGSVTRPLYGLDGNWTVAKVGSDNLLIGGMRQGGSNIYAVKLPTTRTGIPELKWKITPATTGFSRLGYTWSQPVLTRVRVGGQEKDVVVFGGGLDYSTYEIGGSSVVASTGNLGNAVYMVDAATGNLVWSAASGGATGSSYTSVSQMQYSVPGSVRVMDKNADRMADHLYFGDVGGQLFRVDIDNTSSAPRLVKRVAPLAKLGAAETSSKANDRRIYEMPAVAYVKDSAGKIYAAVTVGTGNRNYPKSDRAVQDRFYMVKDYDAARFDILGSSITEAGDGSGATLDLATFRSGAVSPFVTADLTDVTSTLGATATTAVAASKGWYINMPAAAEKVLSAPMIFSKRNTANDSLIYEVHFNSFAPDSSASSACTPVAGQTNAWSVLLSNGSGSPTNNLNTDGSTVSTDRYDAGVANGIAGTDVGLIRENAQGDLELKK